MKAIVHYRCGSPDVLRCEEIEKPVPADNEVLIRVRAAAINPLDLASLKGLPFIFRKVFGLEDPEAGRPGRPGVDVAGMVDAIGKSVTEFKAGDAVFGVCISDPRATGVKIWVHRQGTFAEYVCAPEATLVGKPGNVSFAQAAAAPIAALTALQGLRDKGKIAPGKKVLIHGAGGGVGTFAVQIAKSFGAEVTAVTNTGNVDMVRSIGADRVIDYTQEDFANDGQRYDLIFDCFADHSLGACRRVLNREGVYVGVGGSPKGGGMAILTRLIGILMLPWFVSQKLVTFLAKPSKADLGVVAELMAAGKVKPVIDRCFRLSDAPDAFRYLQEGRPRGKVVIAVE